MFHFSKTFIYSFVIKKNLQFISLIVNEKIINNYQINPFYIQYRNYCTNDKHLTHIDNKSNQPTMVDVSNKKETLREAHARCFVYLPDEVKQILNNGELVSKKGPVFTTAIIAGTQGVKKTSDLIPFCHPLFIEKCNFTINIMESNPNKVQIDCIVRITGKTGVEMEALTGCNIAALTIYDMCKALSHNIIIEKCYLVKKTGGKSDISNK